MRFITLFALLVFLPLAVTAQTTTYASPVRIMNTPVPVNGTVTVTPSGGTMPVSGTVAVTPTGSTMPVSGSISVTGTPTVSIAPSGNTVQVAKPKPAHFRMGDQSGAASLHRVVRTMPGNSLIAFEFVSFTCKFPASVDVLNFSIEVSSPPNELDYNAVVGTYYFALTKSAVTPNNNVIWNLAAPTKVYADGGRQIAFELTLSAPAEMGACPLTLSGQVY